MELTLRASRWRPPPTEAPPAGLVWALRPAQGWELVGRHAQPRRCRFVGGRPRAQCPNTAVARLFRPRYRATSPSSTWWPYCFDHMYGRLVWAAGVYEWHLAEAAKPLVCAGRRVTEETLQPIGPACGRRVKPDRYSYVDPDTRLTVWTRPETMAELLARARAGRGWAVPPGHPELAMCNSCRGSIGSGQG